MAGQGQRSGKATLFTPISHPVLRRVGQSAVRVFLNDGWRYLIQIAERNADPDVHSLPVSLKSSVDYDVRRNLVFLGQFGDQVTKEEDVTEDVLSKWLKAREAARFVTPIAVEKAVKFVHMRMSEVDLETRVLALVSEYLTALRNVGCIDLPKSNAKKCVEHLV